MTSKRMHLQWVGLLGAGWARFALHVAYDPGMVFTSPYEDPVYFSGSPDVHSGFAAVVVPASENSVRVVRFQTGAACPVIDLASDAPVPLLIGSAGGWAGGELQDNSSSTVLFAKYEVPVSKINVPGAVDTEKIVSPLVALDSGVRSHRPYRGGRRHHGLRRGPCGSGSTAVQGRRP